MEPTFGGLGDEASIERKCHEWGLFFNRPRAEVARDMAAKAEASGLTQREDREALLWDSDDGTQVAFFLIDHPGELGAVRGMFDAVAALQPPLAFAIVHQRTERDDRGDVVFDIFRLNRDSYLWHFYRVYTPKAAQQND